VFLVTIWLRAGELVLVLKLHRHCTNGSDRVCGHGQWSCVLTAPEMSELVESAVAPSLKVTVPTGVPLARRYCIDVAVKDHRLAKTLGLVEDVSVVVVVAGLTVLGHGAAVLCWPVKLLSPL